MNPSPARPEPASLFKGPRNESLQDMVLLFDCGCVRPADCSTGHPLSHTLRALWWGAPVTRHSLATFGFPQNSFVWQFQKIDSRHPSPTTHHPLPPAPGFLVPSALPRPPAASPCTSSACAAAAGRAARWSRVAVQGRWCRVAPAPCTAHTGATEPSQAKCPVRRPWPGAQPALCLSARALAAPGSRRPRPQAAKGNNKPHTRGPHDGTTTTSPSQNGMRAAGDEHRQARTALNGLPAFPGTPLHARGRRGRLLPVQGPG